MYDVLRAASVNTVMHYNIPVGLLRISDPADFIVIDNLKDFNILQTYIAGKRDAGGAGLPLRWFSPAPCICPHSQPMTPAQTIRAD